MEVVMSLFLVTSAEVLMLSDRSALAPSEVPIPDLELRNPHAPSDKKRNSIYVLI